MKTDPCHELHNIAELDASCGYPGPLVRRIPRAVAERLVTGTLVSEDAALCELRFTVVSGRRLAVVLTALAGGDLFIYRGDFLHSHVRLPAGQVYRHILDYENDPLARLRPEAFVPRAFAPEVWRVVFDGPTLLHGVDLMGSVIRPPTPDQKPALRWLAYGSSITHGFTPVTRQQCYVAQTARRLGIDVINLGLSGSCFCEAVMSDYLASRADWDFATCELGVNMRNTVAPEEFARRARYLVEQITTARPGKPLVLISPFPTGNDWLPEPDLPARNTRGYEAALRALAGEFAGRGVHLIEGGDILTRVSGLTCDLVHPSTEGHTLMAENLAARLRALVSVLR
jgi:lysophospholipase L1-like esterase